MQQSRTRSEMAPVCATIARLRWWQLATSSLPLMQRFLTTNACYVVIKHHVVLRLKKHKLKLKLSEVFQPAK